VTNPACGDALPTTLDAASLPETRIGSPSGLGLPENTLPRIANRVASAFARMAPWAGELPRFQLSNELFVMLTLSAAWSNPIADPRIQLNEFAEIVTFFAATPPVNWIA
jgi:hypothetical protein